jgi:MED7 protein
MYRPHQARESLIAFMEAQLDEARREMEMCDRVKARAEGALVEVRNEGMIFGGGGGGGGNKQQKEEHTHKLNGKAADAATPEVEHAKRLLWKLMIDIDIESD